MIELQIYHPLTGIMRDFVLEMRQIESLTKEEGDSDKSILIGRDSLKSRQRGQTQIVCLSPDTAEINFLGQDSSQRQCSLWSLGSRGIEEVFCLIYLHCSKMTPMVCCYVQVSGLRSSQLQIDIFICLLTLNKENLTGDVCTPGAR